MDVDPELHGHVPSFRPTLFVHSPLEDVLNIMERDQY